MNANRELGGHSLMTKTRVEHVIRIDDVGPALGHRIDDPARVAADVKTGQCTHLAGG